MSIDNAFSLHGQVALVTGATSGIGQRMAGALAKAGARIVVVGRNAERLQKTVDHIVAEGGEAAPVRADLDFKHIIDDLYRHAEAPFGAPTILINAAGINLRESWSDVTLESWDQTMHLNLGVPFFLARACVPGMIEKGYGRIINIASLQSYRAFADSMPYGASKGGIVQLTRAMAEAWSKEGICANAIAPGFFPTELTAAVFNDPEKAAHNARMTAFGRNGELADLDGISVFLSAPASAYITGQTIPVDGGFTAK
ncbi:MAG: gluconate 5-dehydrogenase [Nitrospinae bacterium CG11_big_fil_rev_8_21_14_0_20_56_8]|nr:MAG: gluconate 5-dehydrogenase [Nitrospinae bacterium CG11_big_fil_rev_8_21_14_0_20_56_8]